MIKTKRKGETLRRAMVNYNDTVVPPIQTVERRVKSAIIGQDSQVRKTITAIYKSILMDSLTGNILIIGPSGSGKTEMIKQIAQELNRPCTIEDITQYSKVGYYGSDVVETIYNLLDNAGGDVEAASKGIVVIDEIDKKSASGEKNDVSGVEVLRSLLKLMEGSVVSTIVMQTSKKHISEEDKNSIIEERLEAVEQKEGPLSRKEREILICEIEEDLENETVELEVPIKFDTSGLTFVFMGAFIGLEKITKERKKNGGMGFNAKTTETQKTDQSVVLKKDLVKYGMIEEFVGRIDTIIEMNTLTEQDLCDILSKSKLSIFKRYRRELKNHGIKLIIPSEVYLRVAQCAKSLDTGARELSTVVNKMFSDILYEIFANPGKYSECRLGTNITSDNTDYKLS